MSEQDEMSAPGIDTKCPKCGHLFLLCSHTSMFGRCQATVNETWYNRNKDRRCKARATVKVAQFQLCARHKKVYDETQKIQYRLPQP